MVYFLSVLVHFYLFPWINCGYFVIYLYEVFDWKPCCNITILATCITKDSKDKSGQQTPCDKGQKGTCNHLIIMDIFGESTLVSGPIACGWQKVTTLKYVTTYFTNVMSTGTIQLPEWINACVKIMRGITNIPDLIMWQNGPVTRRQSMPNQATTNSVNRGRATAMINWQVTAGTELPNWCTFCQDTKTPLKSLKERNLASVRSHQDTEALAL